MVAIPSCHLAAITLKSPTVVAVAVREIVRTGRGAAVLLAEVTGMEMMGRPLYPTLVCSVTKVRATWEVIALAVRVESRAEPAVAVPEDKG